jgi:hypothetical protein
LAVSVKHVFVFIKPEILPVVGFDPQEYSIPSQTLSDIRVPVAGQLPLELQVYSYFLRCFAP